MDREKRKKNNYKKSNILIKGENTFDFGQIFHFTPYKEVIFKKLNSKCLND